MARDGLSPNRWDEQPGFDSSACAPTVLFLWVDIEQCIFLFTSYCLNVLGRGYSCKVEMVGTEPVERI